MVDNSEQNWLGKIKADCCLRYSLLAFLFIVNFLSFIALIVGLVFREQCTIEQNIAVYLIVAGFIFTIYYIFLVILMCMLIRTDPVDLSLLPKRKHRGLALSIAIICFFMTAWLIVGSVWVFRAKMNVQSYDNTLSTYCPSTLYDYSFFYSIFLFIICFIHYICFCCLARKI